MKSILILVIFVTATLAGCASLSRDQCLQGDWYAVGVGDGQLGMPVDRLDQHLKACSQYGVGIDQQRYLEGRADGLAEYCQLDNAFATGLNGHRYQGACPPAMDAPFERANKAAYEVYTLRQELDSIDSQLATLEDDLLDRDLADHRRRLRAEIRELDRQRDRLRADLYAAQCHLDRLMDEARFLP
ncbi:MAG: DUF2799 domain-containing protein [Desulfobulbus sp.]|jgi:hypothetical protein|nr:DUF2799 domain-containing protein [Desulfobulbus sp.]